MDDLLTNDIELIKNHCVELFSLRDFVMEPQVIPTLLAFFQAGGQPEQVVDLLSENYHSYGQLVNLLGCWLSDLETDGGAAERVVPSTSSATNCLADAQRKIESCATVRDCFESTISSMISKAFCAESADKIFEMEGSQGIDWLPELISHRPCRRLIFQLAEHFPNCLMLNFAVKLISDAGFQDEISNVNTAAQHLDVFSRVFLSSMGHLMGELTAGGVNSDVYERSFAELFRVACHSDQTFLYTQALLHVLAKKEKGKVAAYCSHVAQSLCLELERRGEDISAVCIAMMQTDTDRISPRVIQAVLTMNAKRALNPADITQLYQAYFEPNPPPIGIIRDPFFLDMLIDALFNLSRPTINLDHRPKYVYLLAYAGCVGETTRNGMRVQSKVELEAVRRQAEELVGLLHHNADLDMLASLRDLLTLAGVPILGACILHYVRTLLMRDEYLGEPQPIHFVLIDQIATQHTNLHLRIFKMLCELYEYESACNEVAEIIMERQRAIIDRFVHLLLCGYSIPVIERLTKMFKDGQIDVSLVRYFGAEVLESIGGPYSEEFMRAFLPIIGHAEVFDALTLERNTNAKEFLEQCTKAISISTS